MRRIGFCLLQLFVVLTAVAQEQTARITSMNPNTNGYYEYLPEGYSTSNQKYPLILFLHGADELSNGGKPLSALLEVGLPHLIDVDSFPSSFTVNGQTHRFIVISPQFKQWPSALD